MGAVHIHRLTALSAKAAENYRRHRGRLHDPMEYTAESIEASPRVPGSDRVSSHAVGSSAHRLAARWRTAAILGTSLYFAVMRQGPLARP